VSTELATFDSSRLPQFFALVPTRTNRVVAKALGSVRGMRRSTTASTHRSACSGTSTAAESMMIGASILTSRNGLPRNAHRGWLTGHAVPNYLGVSPRFASSRTDFVVADLSIVDLVDRPHAAGGFVICLANTR
jgi:hypothetical protein